MDSRFRGNDVIEMPSFQRDTVTFTLAVAVWPSFPRSGMRGNGKSHWRSLVHTGAMMP